MDNVQVPIFVESRYKVNRKRIKSKIAKILLEHDIKSPAEVSVAIVGDRKMRDLSRKYKGEDRTRNILSFSLVEGDSSYIKSEKLKLGDLVISYPQVIKEASRDEMLVDDKIDELIEHGMLHLLGINHG
ncbi:rRNA maturation RNase YbeY [Candidatus Roizmanbacteria bacterium]|nr:rRNA maturation RNase YbeY [Candidatus Roizmanbacteria bacterium]